MELFQPKNKNKKKKKKKEKENTKKKKNYIIYFAAVNTIWTHSWVLTVQSFT